MATAAAFRCGDDAVSIAGYEPSNTFPPNEPSNSRRRTRATECAKPSNRRRESDGIETSAGATATDYGHGFDDDLGDGGCSSLVIAQLAADVSIEHRRRPTLLPDRKQREKESHTRRQSVKKLAPVGRRCWPTSFIVTHREAVKLGVAGPEMPKKRPSIIKSGGNLRKTRNPFKLRAISIRIETENRHGGGVGHFVFATPAATSCQRLFDAATLLPPPARKSMAFTCGCRDCWLRPTGNMERNETSNPPPR